MLASFCLVHALQMLARVAGAYTASDKALRVSLGLATRDYATRADLLLHVAFIVMLPSSLLVLASFYPVHALQMLANYV